MLLETEFEHEKHHPKHNTWNTTAEQPRANRMVSAGRHERVRRRRRNLSLEPPRTPKHVNFMSAERQLHTNTVDTHMSTPSIHKYQHRRYKHIDTVDTHISTPSIETYQHFRNNNTKTSKMSCASSKPSEK